MFAQVMLHGRQWGTPGSPVALVTRFEWVLAGSTNSHADDDIMTHHAALVTGDELLYHFWKIEEPTQERSPTYDCH